jgi:hypothetical protein
MCNELSAIRHICHVENSKFVSDAIGCLLGSAIGSAINRVWYHCVASAIAPSAGLGRPTQHDIGEPIQGIEPSWRDEAFLGFLPLSTRRD